MEKKSDCLESEISLHDDVKDKNTQNEENACDSRPEMVQSVIPSNKELIKPADAVETSDNNVNATTSSASNQKEIVNRATPIAKQPFYSHNTVTKERIEQVRPQSAEPYFQSRDNLMKTSSHATNRHLEVNKTLCTSKTCKDVTNATTTTPASALAIANKHNRSEKDNQVYNDPHHSSHQPVEPTRPSSSELLSSTSTSTSMIVHASSSSNRHVHHTMPRWHSSHTHYRPMPAELTSSPSSSTSSLDRQRSASMKWPHIRRSASSPHHLRTIASQPVMTPSTIHPQSLIHSQNMNEGSVQHNNTNVSTIQEIDNVDTHVNCKDNNTNKLNVQRTDHEVASGININVFKPSSTNNINNSNVNISNELMHSSSQPQTPSESAQMRHMHFSQIQRTAPSVLRNTHAASSPQLLSNTSHLNSNNMNDTSAVESYSDDARHTPRAQLAPPLSLESLHRNFATQDTSTNMSICTGRSTSSRWSTSLNTPREEPSYPNTQFIHANVQNTTTNTITSNTSTQPSRQSVSPNVLLTPMPLPTPQQHEEEHSISALNAVNTTMEPNSHEENELLLPMSVVDLEKQYTEEAANLSRDELERSVCELRNAHRVQMNRLDNLEKKYAELERGLNAHFAVAEMPQEAISNHFLRQRDKLEKRKTQLMTRYEQIEKEIETKQTELQQVNSTIDKIERLINRDFNQNSMWEVTTLLQAQAANTKVERMLKDEKCTLQELEMLINALQSEEAQTNEQESESLTNTTSASREQEEQEKDLSSTSESTTQLSTSENKQDKTEIESRNDAIQNTQRDDREITNILRDEIAELVKSKNEQEKRIKSLKKSKQEISRRLRKVQEDKKKEGDKVAKIEREYKNVKNTVMERSTKLHFAQEIESERLLNTRSITSFSNLEMPYGATPHHSQSRTPHRNWSVARSNSSYGRSDTRATSSIQQHKHAQVAHTNTKDVTTDNNNVNNRNDEDDRTCTEDYADDENDESDEEEWEAVNNNNNIENKDNNVTDVEQSEQQEHTNESKNNTNTDRNTHNSIVTDETHHECKSNAWPLSFTSLLNTSSSWSSQIHSHGHVPEQLPTATTSTELTETQQHHQHKQEERESPHLSSTNLTNITQTQTHLSNAQDRIETYTSPADWLRQGVIHQVNNDTNWQESFAPPLSLTSRHATQRINTNTNTNNNDISSNTPSKDRTHYSATSTLLENNPHVALTSASSSSTSSFVQPATQEHSESVDLSRHHTHSSSWTLPSQSHPITPHHNVISVQETARMSAPHLLNSSESTPQRVFCQEALDSITHLDLNEDYDTNVTENYYHHNNNNNDNGDEHADKS